MSRPRMSWHRGQGVSRFCSAGYGRSRAWWKMTWWPGGKTRWKPGEKHGLNKVNSWIFGGSRVVKLCQAYIYWIYWSKIWNLLESYRGALIIPHFWLLALSQKKITQTPVVYHQVFPMSRQTAKATDLCRQVDVRIQWHAQLTWPLHALWHARPLNFSLRTYLENRFCLINLSHWAILKDYGGELPLLPP